MAYRECRSPLRRGEHEHVVQVDVVHRVEFFQQRGVRQCLERVKRMNKL